MQKKKWIFLALLLVIPGLMFSVSCQKKLVDASPKPEAKPAPQPEPEKDYAWSLTPPVGATSYRMPAHAGSLP